MHFWEQSKNVKKVKMANKWVIKSNDRLQNTKKAKKPKQKGNELRDGAMSNDTVLYYNANLIQYDHISNAGAFIAVFKFNLKDPHQYFQYP